MIIFKIILSAMLFTASVLPFSSIFNASSDINLDSLIFVLTVIVGILTLLVAILGISRYVEIKDYTKKIEEFKTQIEDDFNDHKQDIETKHDKLKNELLTFKTDIKNDSINHKQDVETKNNSLKNELLTFKSELEKGSINHKQDVETKNNSIKNEFLTFKTELEKDYINHKQDVETKISSLKNEFLTFKTELEKVFTNHKQDVETKSNSLKDEILTFKTELENGYTNHKQDIEEKSNSILESIKTIQYSLNCQEQFLFQTNSYLYSATYNVINQMQDVEQANELLKLLEHGFHIANLYLPSSESNARNASLNNLRENGTMEDIEHLEYLAKHSQDEEYRNDLREAIGYIKARVVQQSS